MEETALTKWNLSCTWLFKLLRILEELSSTGISENELSSNFDTPFVNDTCEGTFFVLKRIVMEEKASINNCSRHYIYILLKR
ncbi:hypothetical protein VNO77_16271 [Canavalia gladiata]|uniref:Uncharacterized protein n=1 Tax=Canavalia gladiata TaxID=3824 RepID=A0AAN9QWG0_CANGL